MLLAGTESFQIVRLESCVCLHPNAQQTSTLAELSLGILHSKVLAKVNGCYIDISCINMDNVYIYICKGRELYIYIYI